MKTITVKFKNVYGNFTVYPVCEDARSIAAIANTKTLTTETLKHVFKLGYSLNVEDRFYLHDWEDFQEFKQVQEAF